MPTKMTSTGITFPDLTTQTTAASAGGQVQSELFTAPGTWTKPASCTQVRVTVIGAGGGGSPGSGNPGAGGPGGTSSFGSLVSATGGNGAGPTNPSNGAAGSATVTTGTAIMRKSFPVAGTGLTVNQLQGEYYSVGSITGRLAPGSVSAVAYSLTGVSMAGAGGMGDNGDGRFGGPGGVAVAICPVSGPVAITVGSGGNPNNPPASSQGGGTGGVVLVEFVG